jgi:hypothetical protein
MPRYQFYVTTEDTTTNLSFEADDIYTVLERFQAFLKVSEFPFVDEVTAVAFDAEDESRDLYYFSDGTAMTAEEIDNQEDAQ